jgi:hypothetical protein
MSTPATVGLSGPSPPTEPSHDVMATSASKGLHRMSSDSNSNSTALGGRLASIRSGHPTCTAPPQGNAVATPPGRHFWRRPARMQGCLCTRPHSDRARRAVYRLFPSLNCPNARLRLHSSRAGHNSGWAQLCKTGRCYIAVLLKEGGKMEMRTRARESTSSCSAGVHHCIILQDRALLHCCTPA